MMKPSLFIFLFTISFATWADSGTCDIGELLECDMESPQQQQKSPWQFGVGISAIKGVPDYIGSDESRNFILPVPYITYNSPKLKISQGGITAKMFNSDNWYLSVSLSGAIPVNSDSNAARRGMDDLEAVFEYGPSLKYYLLGDEYSANATYIDLNFREGRTLSLDTLDISSSPSVVVRRKLQKQYLGGEIRWSAVAKMELVSNAYADYFYSVQQKDVTEQRSAYRARGGFAGYRLSSNLRWKKQQHIVSLFLGYADISNASYVNSPLVKQQSHVFGGSAYFWLF